MKLCPRKSIVPQPGSAAHAGTVNVLGLADGRSLEFLIQVRTELLDPAIFGVELSAKTITCLGDIDHRSVRGFKNQLKIICVFFKHEKKLVEAIINRGFHDLPEFLFLFGTCSKGLDGFMPPFGIFSA
jgi:hypothetical protein